MALSTGAAHAAAHTRPEWFGYVVLLGGVLIHLSIGSYYFWGNFTTYVTSAARREHPSLKYSDTILCFLLCPCVQGLLMFTARPGARLIGHRGMAFIGTAVLSLIFCCAHALHHGLLPLLAAYGLVFGVAQGCLYTVPITVALTYLPTRPGLITGVITLGFGMGAFFLNFVVNAVLNPHDCSPVCPGPDFAYPDFKCPGYHGGANATAAAAGPLAELTCKGSEKFFPPNSQQVDDTPDFFNVLAVTYVVLCSIGTLLMIPQGESLIPSFRLGGRKQVDGEEEEAPASIVVANTEKSGLLKSDPMRTGTTHRTLQGLWHTGLDYSPKEMMSCALGWQMFVGIFLTASTGIFFVGNYKTLGQKGGWSTDSIESNISSAIAILNGLGRIAHGTLSDYFGWTKVLCVSAFFTTVLILTVNLTTDNEYIFAIWCVLIAFCYGGTFSMYPTGVATVFGNPHFPTNYAVIFNAFGFGALTMGLVNQALVDRIGVWGMCGIFGGLTGIGTLNAVSMHFKVQALLEGREAESAIGSSL